MVQKNGGKMERWSNKLNFCFTKPILALISVVLKLPYRIDAPTFVEIGRAHV